MGGPGGSANAYDYCTADPVNCTDLAGTFTFTGLLKAVAVVGEIASLIPGPVGAAAAGISAVAYAAQGNTSKALEMGITAAAALIGAGAVVKVAAAGLVAAKAGQIAMRAGPKLSRAVSRAASALRPCNSFTPGTLVLLADGTLVPIEELRAGDLVWSTDPISGQSTAEPVLAEISGTGTKHLVQVTTDGGTWTATAEHPVWVANIGWRSAIDLGPGDQLTQPDGTTLNVLSVTDLGDLSGQTVHNITVANTHTYYIADRSGDSALVHNAAACGLTSRAARREAMRSAGIPTSMQPTRQIRTIGGNALLYRMNGRTHAVVNGLTDRSHVGRPHWEAGPIKVPVRLDPLGRPRLRNGKSHVFY